MQNSKATKLLDGEDFPSNIQQKSSSRDTSE